MFNRRFFISAIAGTVTFGSAWTRAFGADLEVPSFARVPVPAEDRKNGRNDHAYDPAHDSTEDEKKAFIARLKPGAIRLNRDIGLPGSVIVAMAIVESGCGLTRTAVFANNYFGIKRYGAPQESYQLIGQPGEDEPNAHIIEKINGDEDRVIFDERKRTNNWYRKFTSPDACLDYLGRTFLQSTRYKPATDHYLANRKAGMSKNDAAAAFIKEIGDRGYHHKGGDYYRSIIFPFVKKYNLVEFDK